MASEINFIKEIEKRECLYNNCLPEYNRRDISEQAWEEVAQLSNITVSECKEKWRNIRSSLLRSIKKSGKVKKPYYLSPYLHFVVPFMKTNQKNSEESQREESQPDIEINIEESIIKSETDVDESQNPFESIDLFQADIPNENESVQLRIESPVYRGRRRSIVSRRYDDRKAAFKRKRSMATLEPNRSSGFTNSSMRYFLLSLLPEFETMTEDQTRLFKIKVMMLIDDIKSNSTESSQTSSESKATAGLQKRLINLLIKNLKKNS